MDAYDPQGVIARVPKAVWRLRGNDHDVAFGDELVVSDGEGGRAGVDAWWRRSSPALTSTEASAYGEDALTETRSSVLPSGEWLGAGVVNLQPA
jgi:hypothetical protein